jgi:hypothetical protein
MKGAEVIEIVAGLMLKDENKKRQHGYQPLDNIIGRLRNYYLENNIPPPVNVVSIVYKCLEVFKGLNVLGETLSSGYAGHVHYKLQQAPSLKAIEKYLLNNPDLLKKLEVVLSPMQKSKKVQSKLEEELAET